jgi:hypothetical protein
MQVLDKLKTGNMFPKKNRITDTSASITAFEKSDGALSSANIEAFERGCPQFCVNAIPGYGL